MKVTQEKLPASQVALEIEVEGERSQKVYERVVQEFMRSMNIPGFRKGKAPRHVIIQRVGSGRISAAVLEELIQDSLSQAIEEQEIQAIGNFQLKSEMEDLLQNFKPGAPLTFTAAVDVRPEVKLGTYKNLSVTAERVDYDPSRVDKTLDEYRTQRSTLVPVEDRPAAMGDVALVDFEGRTEDGEPIEGGKAEDFQIELSEGRFVEGFIEGVVGMAINETREVPVKFPEGYPEAKLAGKPAVFTITLKDIKTRELPELNDEFAQDASEHETLAELRASLEQEYRDEAEQQTEANKERAILEALLKEVEVELPETLVRREIDYLLNQSAMNLQQRGVDINQLFTQQNLPMLRERSRPEAIERLQRTLVLAEISKREGLKVEPAALEERLGTLIEQYGDRDIDRNKLKELVEDELLTEQILDWLKSNSTVELVEPKPPEEASDAVVDAAAEIGDTAEEAEGSEPIETSAEEVAEEAAEA
ncbi:trigger factor [Leptolyngbya sp. FACHB-261]|uniref:trigger factor n=1 Tax=Leptolyngbya sp. FACHB-261 TaxID=2692806 RepID=UPI00168426AF|nr:trigger factor [Leptolyngbya sp. FACHB-261]MBD2101295.1 trigger factor [Leptolyngbya sp. FACHB-261]